MSDSGLAVFGQVAGIGGLALGVLLVLYREVLRGLNAQLRTDA